MRDKKTVTRIRFNGREFRRVRWTGPECREMGARAIVVTWAVRENVRPCSGPGWFAGTFISRREVR